MRVVRVTQVVTTEPMPIPTNTMAFAVLFMSHPCEINKRTFSITLFTFLTSVNNEYQEI